ncbi:hypothetical protein A9Q84_21580 [Halobacteriovorax marinus]|uniref:N-acetyltransferase domain-containing protein n=1 Tax=Halobacteriovorax marinus TaxID=97084 RepID=A0A1Y5F1S2_9BACT|nr:hypothetical protein A9Q84_21580 [Halobacteriovorax marinus]
MSKLIQTTLAKAPNFFNETLSLLEKSFNYPKHQNFLTDFYPLMAPINHDHCHILIDKDKVVGHIGVKKRTLTYKDTSLEVVLLGGIAISENYQGQGNFSKFFTDILDRYKDKCGLMLLWSDLSALYNRYGFYEAGGVIQTGKKQLLKESLPIDWCETSFKQIDEKKFEQIKTLYANQSRLTLKRDESLWSGIREISSAKLFYKEEDNKIVSYVVMGKGNDLEGIIHELVATKETENDVIESFSDFKLWLPEKYNSLFHKKELLYGAFLKIGNVPLLNSFLENLSKNQLQIISIDGDDINISHNENDFKLNIQDFLTGLLGPTPITEFQEFMPSFFINGLDSI